MGAAPVKLSFGQRCADRLVERLRPFCHRIEIAGSIRRQRAEVGDVDLVAIAKEEEGRDLFGQVVARRNLLAKEIVRWCAAEKWRLEKAGRDYLVFHAKGVQVDLWFASEITFGSLLLCRTGSARHNIWLAERAQRRGAKWHPYVGLYQANRCIASRSEEDIYAALGLPLLDPVNQRDEPAFRRFDTCFAVAGR
jgi:DNA polymerase (family 10)